MNEKVPVGGTPPEAGPVPPLKPGERAGAIRFASDATDAMRINLRFGAILWNARDVLEGGAQPVPGVPEATARLVQDAARRVLAALEEARPGHLLRLLLATPIDDDVRRNGLVMTCKKCGEVTDVALDRVAKGLVCSCGAAVAPEVAKRLATATRGLRTLIEKLDVVVAIRAFDAPTEAGWR